MRQEKVFSFAVFDTVLTRQVATSRGVFCLLRHQLRTHQEFNLPAHFIEEFLEIRLSAERSALEDSEWEGITLDEIYAQIRRRFAELPVELIETVKQAELRLEAELIIGVPEMIRHVHALMDAGERVIFISDTYFSEAQVRGFLRSVDSRMAECPLYVSSALGKTKVSGRLFSHVLASEGIGRRALVHQGDNIEADVKAPRSLGIRGTLYQGASLSEFEFAYFEEDNDFSQLLA